MRQRPFAQRNWFGPQVGYSVRSRVLGQPTSWAPALPAPSQPVPLTTFRGFIAAVTAVVVMVTHKVFRDALPVLTKKLRLVTGVVEYWGEVGI